MLEAGRANVFAVADGGLLTPPADGRILPGTARGAVLDLAAELGVPAAERRLALADLRRADESSSPPRCAASAPCAASTASPARAAASWSSGSPTPSASAGSARAEVSSP